MKFQRKELIKIGSVFSLVCGLLIQINGQSTFDLSTVEPDEIPSGATLSWYSAIPVTDETNVINDVSAVGPGIYYAVYRYDETCYSAPAPYRLLETSCPEGYADITAAVDSTDKPTGYMVTYHTAQPVSDANRLGSDPKQAQPGSYYASYYDPVAMCYTGSSPITVLEDVDCKPDLTPFILFAAGDRQLIPGETVELAVRYTNVGPSSTNGECVFYLTRELSFSNRSVDISSATSFSDGFETISFDTDKVDITVNATNFEIRTKPGVVIGPNGSINLPFKVTNTNSVLATSPITASVLNGTGGGELPYTNNVKAYEVYYR